MPDPSRPKARFLLVLIKPSHYDDEGYVIQWWRSPIPSNSLACVYGIAREARDSGALGPDVALDILPLDETNTRVRVARLADDIRRAGAGMVMLVGVQSNQFPRALDIARAFRTQGVDVAIGGFHVSGARAMLPGVEANAQAALDLGCSLFAGEAEASRLVEVLRDAIAGALRPVYDFMDDLPALEGAPTPHLPAALIRRTAIGHSSFDAGRGCPFQCSFCTIINVQGRRSRRRSPDDIEKIIRDNHAQGVTRYFITDDNFARNKDWSAIFDRLIELREQGGIPIKLIIQVDTLCHRLPLFVEKAARAGVRHVFIGLENVSPDNLTAAKKRQNKITEYRAMLQAWKRAGVITYCGYILGFPNDTPERILRDVEVVKRELPVDILEFFFLTPLPGSEDHQRLARAGAWMDPDLNKYDLNHCVVGHPHMSREAWEGAYRFAWRRFYSRDHMRRVLARNRATGGGLDKVSFMLGWFSGAILIEGVHPLECGVLRRKVRRDRRHGLPLEEPLAFYPRYWAETLGKMLRWGGLLIALAAPYLRFKHGKPRLDGEDPALAPVTAQDDGLDLFQTEEAKTFVVQERRLAAIRAGAPATQGG